MNILIVFALGLVVFHPGVSAAAAEEDDTTKPYCISSQSDGGTARLFIRLSDSTCTNEVKEGQCLDICYHGFFFDFKVNPDTQKPIGCTLCPEGYFMSEKNFCPECFPCRNCTYNETETVPCHTHFDRQCVPRVGETASSRSHTTDEQFTSTGDAQTIQPSLTTGRLSEYPSSTTVNPPTDPCSSCPCSKAVLVALVTSLVVLFLVIIGMTIGICLYVRSSNHPDVPKGGGSEVEHLPLQEM